MSTDSADPADPADPSDSAVPAPAVPVASVRPAREADVPALAEAAAATFVLACPPSMTRDRVEAFVEEVLSPARFTDDGTDAHRHVLLAERYGSALGYAMLVAGDPQDEDVSAA